MARRLLALASLAAAAASEPHRHAAINYAAARVQLDANVAIGVNATTLSNGGCVTVSFSAPAPAASDFVAAYSPPGAHPATQAPVEWKAAKAAPGYLASGNGTLTFCLVNMRAAYEFAFLRGGLAKPTLAAASPNVTFANVAEPLHPRLALTADGRGMTVTWQSASRDGHPAVTLTGPSGGGTLKAHSVTYNASDMCGAPATTVGYRSPGFIHSATFPALTPGGAYFYTFGDDFGRGGPVPFTQPAVGAFPFGIAAYGDEGGLAGDGSAIENDFPPAPNTSALVAACIDEGVCGAVLHNGDIRYEKGG